MFGEFNETVQPKKSLYHDHEDNSDHAITHLKIWNHAQSRAKKRPITQTAGGGLITINNGWLGIVFITINIRWWAEFITVICRLAFGYMSQSTSTISTCTIFTSTCTSTSTIITMSTTWSGGLPWLTGVVYLERPFSLHHLDILKICMCLTLEIPFTKSL